MNLDEAFNFAGIKPFKCKQCERSFARFNKLRKHVICVHEGLKPCRCEVCEKGFHSRHDLLRHITAVHNGERPYNCNYCGKAFHSKGDVKRHVGRLHKDRIVEEARNDIKPDLNVANAKIKPEPE
ncbi:unnamed protein product [Hymenolepis diminuta]|uniref:C2H2-type domain-containing protein n=1 Tax=Hymenolepis diminuta TaxID=6216 RepID=A0A0R3SHL2_HYMDI|nr:unnamed protein product [Hymenolepis diminuta]